MDSMFTMHAFLLLQVTRRSVQCQVLSDRFYVYNACFSVVAGNKEMCAVPGSVRWTAPEVLAFPTADEYNHFDILTPACDVYSYAMVLWEVATGLDPFEDIPDDSEVCSWI